MPKALIRRYLPDPERIREQKSLGFLRHRLGDPSLWHLNRRSASWAVFWGLFCAFLPMPLQMVPAAIGALLFRINLPLVMLLVWVTNPLTLLPCMYAGYWLGSELMGVPMLSWQELELLGRQMLDGQEMITASGGGLWLRLQPFLLGTTLLGLLLGALGYLLMRLYWRWHAVRAWRRRRAARRRRAQG